METVTNNMNFFHKSRGLGIGILLIVIGAVLLGVNFGYISPAIKPVIFSWQSLIILVVSFTFETEIRLYGEVSGYW